MNDDEVTGLRQPDAAEAGEQTSARSAISDLLTKDV
jgi:hypothetical protein